MSEKRKWIPIAIGVAILLVFIGIGALVFSASYIREHLQVADSDESDAMRAFDEIHAKFPGPAMLELRDGRAIRVDEPAREPASDSLTTLHVLAWDPENGRLARFDLPFWLLRMKSGPIGLRSYASGLDETVRITPAEIEKRGPGIVLDFTDPRRNRARALVWAD